MRDSVKRMMAYGVAAFMSAGAACADSGTWNVDAGGNWETPGNWLNGTVAGGSGYSADFNSKDITDDRTITLGSPVTIGNLIFGDTDTGTAAGWTLSGSDLTLDAVAPTITVNALGTGKSVTINTTVEGSVGFAKEGDGTLVFKRVATYNGSTTINAGAIQLQLSEGGAPTAGLINYWTFDEGTGTVAADTATEGTRRDGTLTTPQGGWTTTDKKYGNAALAVDGQNGAAAAAVSMGNILSAAQPRTISAWVKATSTPPPPNHPVSNTWGDYHLFGSTGRSWRWGGQWEWFGFCYTPSFSGGALVVSTQGGNAQEYNDRKVNVRPWSSITNSWHMLTVSHPGGTGTIKAYFDGELVASADQTLSNPNGFGVANYHSGVSALVDDLRLYNRVLSDSEVLALYNWDGLPPPPSSDFLPTATALTINGGATLDLNGVSQRIASLEGSGAVINSHPSLPSTLTVNNAGTDTFPGTLSSSGDGVLNLAKDGTGRLTLTAASTHTGSTTINANAGALQIGDGTSATATAGTGVLALGDNTTVEVNLNEPATLSNSSVTMNRGATIRNIGTGKLTIRNGSMGGGQGGAVVFLDGGTAGLVCLNPLAANSFNYEMRGDVTVNLWQNWSQITVSGAGSPAPPLVPPTIRLTGANNFWAIVSPSAAYAANLEIQGSLVLNRGGDRWYNNLYGAGTYSVAWGDSPVIGDCILGNCTLAGPITSSRPIGFGDGGTGATVPITTPISTSQAVTFNSTTDNTYSGNMSGSGRVFKRGPNTLVFSGINTYTGATTIEGGTLDVRNTLSNTASVTVNGATAVLAGTSTITTAGGVAVTNGKLTPGQAGANVGKLTVAGSASIGASGNLTVDITGAGGAGNAGVTYDQLSISGTITLDSAGTLTVNSTHQADAGDTYDIVVAGSVIGTFGATEVTASNGEIFKVYYPDGNTIRLIVRHATVFMFR